MIENPMIKLFDELRMAMDEHEAAVAHEASARSELTAALNRLNGAQKAIDKAVAEARKVAPWNTEWHGQEHPPQRCKA